MMIPLPLCDQKITPRAEFFHAGRRVDRFEGCYIFSMIALPNSEHLSNFAPVIRRSKSYVTVLFAIVRAMADNRIARFLPSHMLEHQHAREDHRAGIDLVLVSVLRRG